MIKEQNIHCIGIGGIGLSAIAQLLKSYGKNISGCDATDTPWLQTLRKEGIEISIGHDENHADGKDMIIYTLAIPKDHLELMQANRRGIRTLTYPEALGELTQKFSTIAICGSHGKTTVTAMVSKILIENGYDPTVILGSMSHDLGNTNFRKGKGEWMIIEACEYERAFLEYSPRHIIITNIDHDHFDTYPAEADYRDAFYHFAKKTPKNGFIVGAADDKNTCQLFETLKHEGFPEKNLITVSVKGNEPDVFLDDHQIYYNGKAEAPLHLKLHGIHNRGNALLAYAFCRKLGLYPADILYSLERYEGSGRRLEEKGIIRGVRIIDDYAHHPTEIRASIQALREKYPKEKIWVVYQPHQFIRTKALLPEFGAAFKGVEKVIVPNIYDARDFGTKGSVTVDELITAMKKDFPNARNGGGFEQTTQFLKESWSAFDILVIMGAGDVWKMKDLFIA